MEKKQLAYADLVKLAHEATPEFLDLAKGFVKAQKRLDNTREEVNDGVTYNGKVLCVLKADWLTARAEKKVMSHKSFPDHYEALMGHKPHNKAESCANAFSAYVLSPETIVIGKEMKDGVEVDAFGPCPRHITEMDYDNCTAEAIQQASRVVSRVKDNLDHPALAEAASILRVRPAKSIAKLKRLCERIQYVETGEGDKIVTEIKFLTEEELDKQSANPGIVEVAEMANTLASSPTGLSAMVATILAAALTTENADYARQFCELNVKLPESLSKNVGKDGKRRFPVEQLMAWGRAVMPPEPPRTLEMVQDEYMAARELIAAVDEKVGVGVTSEWYQAPEAPKKKNRKNEQPAEAPVPA